MVKLLIDEETNSDITFKTESLGARIRTYVRFSICNALYSQSKFFTVDATNDLLLLSENTTE